MGILFPPEIRKLHNQIPEPEKSIVHAHMRDDLGMVYGVVGALVRSNAISIDVYEDGFATGYETDLDFAVAEIYRALRTQRAICSKQDVPGRAMLDAEQKDFGY